MLYFSHILIILVDLPTQVVIILYCVGIKYFTRNQLGYCFPKDIISIFNRIQTHPCTPISMRTLPSKAPIRAIIAMIVDFSEAGYYIYQAN